jgi:hypothetical protein
MCNPLEFLKRSDLLLGKTHKMTTPKNCYSFFFIAFFQTYNVIGIWIRDFGY